MKILAGLAWLCLILTYEPTAAQTVPSGFKFESRIGPYDSAWVLYAPEKDITAYEVSLMLPVFTYVAGPYNRSSAPPMPGGRCLPKNPILFQLPDSFKEKLGTAVRHFKSAECPKDAE